MTRGGLLDMNVAGFDPSMEVMGGNADVLASRRGSIGFANLPALDPGIILDLPSSSSRSLWLCGMPQL